MLHTLTHAFVDSDGRDGIRTLRDMGRDVNNDAMTVEMCLDSCEADGYSLAGVEYARECCKLAYPEIPFYGSPSGRDAG